jgi:hypothetical protein
VRADYEQTSALLTSRTSELDACELAKQQASSRLAACEAEARYGVRDANRRLLHAPPNDQRSCRALYCSTSTELRTKLEAELDTAHAARERLEAACRASTQRAAQLDAKLAACAAEREHAAARLGALPDALRTLQTRLHDTLLRPLEETLRCELAPPEAPPAAGAETEPY